MAFKSAIEQPTLDLLPLRDAVRNKYPLGDRKRQPMPAGGLFSTASDVGQF